MSISTSACRFSMNIMAARYAWRFALGARPVGRPPWLRRSSAGENERGSDFFFFLGCISRITAWTFLIAVVLWQLLVTAFIYSFALHFDEASSPRPSLNPVSPVLYLVAPTS